MFEDEKIDFIESLPESDMILIIWIKLLTLAGKTNAKGYIFLTENIPYTDEMLAHKFRRPLNIVRLALETFKMLGMIEDDGQGIYITNWEKHQNIEGMERVRELTRNRVNKHRKEQKLLDCNVTSNATVTQSNAIDIDKELDIDKEKEYIPYAEVRDLYNQICASLPSIRTLSNNRKKSISARWKENKDIAVFEELFKKAESSEFLTGNNNRNWRADFDWLMNEHNMTKVLEGRYQSKPERKEPDATDFESYYGNEPTKEIDW